MVRSVIDNLARTIKFLQYRFRYLINYIIIGFFSVLLEVIAIRLISSQGISGWIAIPFGFMCGVILSFILNARLNFRIDKKQNARTFFIFLTISIIALFINLGLIEFLSASIDADYTSLRFISAGCVFIVSYLAHRKITFRDVKKVGIAVYLSRNESVNKIYSRIRYYADFIHLDILDESIDPGASEIDFSILREVNRTWVLDKQAHLMSRKPSNWIERISPYVDCIIIHTFIEEDVIKTLEKIRLMGKKRGIAVMPNEKIEDFQKYMPYVDFIQVMGINSLGKSGQQLDVRALELARKLRPHSKRDKFEIIFDGGVKTTNINKIPAQYVVSASSLLMADNPIISFMELKTSSRYRDLRQELRKDIIKGITNASERVSFIESATIVGSFAESGSLEGISDLDIVVIADSLNKDKFGQIVNAFNAEKNVIEAKYGYPIYLNTALGPLKFNDRNIVFHLMIYDRASHIEHCIKSPFTCYDWQRSRHIIKNPMTSLYRIPCLQPNFFFNARRSVGEYISELRESKISYREYFFDKKGKISEMKMQKDMNVKDKIEFSYHIMKFLMINLIKLEYKSNMKPLGDSLTNTYFSIFKINKDKHEEMFNMMAKMKESNSYYFEEIFLKSMELFIKDFEEQFRDRYYSGKEIILMRHAKTDLNMPGQYLGQKSDPLIKKLSKEEINNIKNETSEVDKFFSSPAKRCTQTLKSSGIKDIETDDRLKEIDYGLAEGKDINYMMKNHGSIIQSWKIGEDPRFPEGENSRDVRERVFSFLGEKLVRPYKRILICSHNVVLRTILGTLARVPLRDHYKIIVPHNKTLKMVITKDNRIYLDLNPEDFNVAFSGCKYN